ncbi:MAG TPA: DEAD/DEAH box helicase [Xanthobacteraceae bacterium]|nr:DEAD/DEAH box helicase [Xanthobacteraceae bacterium]
MSALSPLRPLQVKAMDMLKRSIASGSKRPVVQAPCGFGKTILGAHVVTGSLAKRNRVAFVVPMLNLIDQTFERFAANGIHPGDMGVMQGDHAWRRPHAPLQICSVQTLDRRGFPDSTFVVVDECHLRYKAIDRWMAERPSTLFIGLSATPWARGMGEHWDDLLVPTSIGELIELGWLSKFRVFAASHPDLSQVKTVAGDYHEGQLADVMSNKTLVADVVHNWLEKGEGRPTLCFAVDRAHSELLHSQFADCGVSAAYVDGDTPREERAAILAAYSAGEIKVICSVGTMTTGVDVPCRCLILARPTKSEMLFVQIIGRGLRTEPGKTDCLIFDHTDTHLRLGMVTDIHHARLRTAKSDAEEKERERSGAADKTPTPRECPQCHCLIPVKTPACPSCGFRPQRVSTVQCEDGELYEYGTAKPEAKAKAKPETAAERLAAQGKQAIYSQLLAMQGAKADGWVAHKYKGIFGVWPRGLASTKAEPTPELQIWIHSQNIKWAKGQARRGDAQGTQQDQGELARAA